VHWLITYYYLLEPGLYVNKFGRVTGICSPVYRKRFKRYPSGLVATLSVDGFGCSLFSAAVICIQCSRLTTHSMSDNLKKYFLANARRWMHNSSLSQFYWLSIVDTLAVGSRQFSECNALCWSQQQGHFNRHYSAKSSMRYVKSCGIASPIGLRIMV